MLDVFRLAKSLRRKVFYGLSPTICHFDEGEISASSSTSKIANLCRVSCGDFSFVEMTKVGKNSTTSQLCEILPPQNL